jgi:hypothetical protein
MLPWRTIIEIDKECDVPVYLQIANSIIQEMKRGRIGPGINCRHPPDVWIISKCATLVRALRRTGCPGLDRNAPLKELSPVKLLK